MAGRPRTLRPEFLLYHAASHFVKSFYENKKIIIFPKMLDFCGRSCYTLNTVKEMRYKTMTTFTMIILVVFISALVAQFMAFVDKDCPFLACLSGAEILMFAYLAKVLM